jgi:hypothetical protein
MTLIKEKKETISRNNMTQFFKRNVRMSQTASSDNVRMNQITPSK